MKSLAQQTRIYASTFLILFLQEQYHSYMRSEEDISDKLYTQAKESSAYCTAQQKERLLLIEGDCKIIQSTLLKVNYPKGIILFILLTLSFVGLLLLKYYKSLRARVFYNQVQPDQPHTATHIFVKGSNKQEEIAALKHSYFFFRYLKYQLVGRQCTPVGLHYLDTIGHYLTPDYQNTGLSFDEFEEREELYGRNQHKVEVPNYFEYLFQVMTKPFFIVQYGTSVIWILEGLTLFALALIFFSALLTSINYVLLYNSYQEIKSKMQKRFMVRVIREGQMKVVENINLVPGDIFEPPAQIPCDSVLIKGELFLNEVTLTGQDTPVSKQAIQDSKRVTDSTHWLYEGSKVQTSKGQGGLAIAIHVGFASRRGRIVRRILTKTAKQPQAFTKLLYFMVQIFLFHIILYFVSLVVLLSKPVDSIMIFFRFLDFVYYSFPATFPVFFQLAYAVCLIRLARKGVVGIEAQKTIQSSRISTVYFDKTGTLTVPEVCISQVYAIPESRTIERMSTSTEQEFVREIFSVCHSVQKVGESLKGDEIDLKMLEESGATIEPSSTQGVIRDIVIGMQRLQVLRIDPFESKFQSMSVLYRRTTDEKCFIAVKGSPEKIHSHSTIKCLDYDSFIKKVSLSGMKSIGFGFRQVNPCKVSELLKVDREELLVRTKILGVVTFVNQLRQDCTDTLGTLFESNIRCKMITGDNIFLGVKTSLMSGIISESDKVLVLEGSRYDLKANSAWITQLSVKEGIMTDKEYKVTHFNWKDQAGIVYAVDNSFIEKKEDFLEHNIAVFARITPQNKAFIVREHKKLEQQRLRSRPLSNRIFSEPSMKVAMVGDGSNDLIAIKEADVGIGLTESDAVYSATFTIGRLSDIMTLILDAKDLERQVTQLAHFYNLLNTLTAISMVLMSSDSSYFSSLHFTYRTYTITIPLIVLSCLSRPAKKLTSHLPPSNFMSLENHFVYWGNVVILGGGVSLGYLIFQYSDSFVANPRPEVTFDSKWNGKCMSASVLTLMTCLCAIIIPIILYRSHPWKGPIYRNFPMCIMILIDIVVFVLIMVNFDHLSWLDLVPLPNTWKWSLAGIILSCGVIGCVFNLLVEFFSLQKHKDQQMAHSKKRRVHSG